MDVRKRWTPADWGMPPGSLMAEAWWLVLMIVIFLALIAAGNPSRVQIEAKARRAVSLPTLDH